MHRGLNYLNRRIRAQDGRIIRRQRHLRQTNRARVGLLGGPGDLEDGDHGQGEVLRHGAFAQVDVHVGGGVALEPAGLQGDGAAGDGPERAVGREGHAAAWGGGLVRGSAWGGEGGVKGMRMRMEDGAGDVHGYIHCMP